MSWGSLCDAFTQVRTKDRIFSNASTTVVYDQRPERATCSHTYAEAAARANHA